MPKARRQVKKNIKQIYTEYQPFTPGENTKSARAMAAGTGDCQTIVNEDAASDGRCGEQLSFRCPSVVLVFD